MLAAAAAYATRLSVNAAESLPIADDHYTPPRYYRWPRRAIQEAIALGGDTDTTAAMVGAIVGALHGVSDTFDDTAAVPVDDGVIRAGTTASDADDIGGKGGSVGGDGGDGDRDSSAVDAGSDGQPGWERRWAAQLENGARGRDYALRLAGKLVDTAESKHTRK